MCCDFAHTTDHLVLNMHCWNGRKYLNWNISLYIKFLNHYGNLIKNIKTYIYLYININLIKKDKIQDFSWVGGKPYFILVG